MPKRVRGDALTGGTGDVNPQLMHGRVTQSGADATTTQAFNVPIARLPQAGEDSALILEILKIWVDFPQGFNGTNAAETTFARAAAFSTVSFSTTPADFNEPTVFAIVKQAKRQAVPAAPNIIDIYSPIIEYDCTDGAGHGLLIGTDQIFVQAQSTATTDTNVIDWKILYRIKRVGLLEYIGIVQSQQ